MNPGMYEALPTRGWTVDDLGPDAAANPDAVAAFASKFGRVSDRDGGSVWSVTARAASGTFSMTAAVAPLHTDAQYRNDPEQAFVLSCVRPAAQGGDTILLRVADLVETLTSRSDWAELEAVLTAPVWRWRTPKVFGGPSMNAPTTVLSRRMDGSPIMRWRVDNLVKDERYTWAAQVVAHVAETHPARAQVRLEAGHVLVCDNSAVLHGRTAFTDPARKLLRVRVHR